MDEPAIRRISPKQFLMIDGQGAPDDSLNYIATLRRVTKAMGLTPGLPEALWWTADGAKASADNMDSWRWTVMIEPSGEPTKEAVDAALDKARQEKDEPALSKIRLETYDEGEVVQLVNKGPLPEKQPKLEAMLAFALAQGYKLTGKYHEIYIDDPGPDSPPDAKTILRQPVAKS